MPVNNLGEGAIAWNTGVGIDTDRVRDEDRARMHQGDLGHN